MQKKEKPGGLTLPNFKALDMQINGRKMNILETDPHKYGQLFLPMMQMQFNAKKKKKRILFSTNRVGAYRHSRYKQTLAYTSQFKQKFIQNIIYIKVKCKTLNF